MFINIFKSKNHDEKMKYKAIDYPSWDFSGKGKNIRHLLEPLELKIWNLSLPYQDTRRGGEVSTYFVFQILKYGDVKCERKITVPAIILHDIGWSQLTQTERDLFYEENETANKQKVWERYEPVLRARHQEEGVKLSRKILTEANYPKEYREDILEIISQHDTRPGFYSPEDGVVRSADRLWRFTLPCLKIALESRGWSLSELEKRFDSWIEQKDFFYSNKIREIARIEKENTLQAY